VINAEPEPAVISSDAYAAGVADVQEDHHAGTPLAVLETRLDYLTSNFHDPTQAAYVCGYAAAVIRIRLHQHAIATAQTTTAFEDQESTR
jgi:hypothetical protein